MTDVLRWIGRVLLRWPVGVVVGLVWVGLVRLLVDTGPRPVSDYVDIVLLFPWYGMPLYVGLLAWRSARPRFRVWAVLLVWVVFLPFPTFLALLADPPIQGVWLCLLTFGALVPPRPAPTSTGTV